MIDKRWMRDARRGGVDKKLQGAPKGEEVWLMAGSRRVGLRSDRRKGGM